jgi:hypothetical protein
VGVVSEHAPICCPFCLSMDPNKVGIEQATGKVCRDPFHCPIPESHSDQPGGVFRYCQYCDYREDPLTEPPADWAVGWVTPPEEPKP